MDEEYAHLAFRPEAPDEKTRRVGQSAAAGQPARGALSAGRKRQSEKQGRAPGAKRLPGARFFLALRAKNAV